MISLSSALDCYAFGVTFGPQQSRFRLECRCALFPVVLSGFHRYGSLAMHDDVPRVSNQCREDKAHFAAMSVLPEISPGGHACAHAVSIVLSMLMTTGS